MIHLYAFTFPGAGLPAVSGIGGAELDSCRIADVAAVVSEVGDDDPGGEREAVLAHGLVVEALRDATSSRRRSAIASPICASAWRRSGAA